MTGPGTDRERLVAALHGELGSVVEIDVCEAVADALLPVVREIVAEELRAAAADWAADPDAVGDSEADARNWLRDRADGLAERDESCELDAGHDGPHWRKDGLDNFLVWEGAGNCAPLRQWRVGRHYGIHVYADDRPVATFHDAADAKRCVDTVNAAATLTQP